MNELAKAYETQRKHLDTAIRERDEARAELAKVNREKYPFVHLRFDVSGAEVESALRAKLIELGWAPPADLPPPSAAPAASEPKRTAEEHCKLFCAWKGGGPCLADDCPRRAEAGAGASEARDVMLENSCKCKTPTPAPFNGEWCYRCGRPLVQQSPAQSEGK